MGTDSADRPARELKEIEITPAMIEAGARELTLMLGFGDPGAEPYEEVAACVFRAMLNHCRADVAV